MLVHDLILKTSLFVLCHLYKTLSRHLSSLFNYACLLIQILQKTDFEFGANAFAFQIRKVNFSELSLWIRILCVKSSEVRYYLELKV